MDASSPVVGEFFGAFEIEQVLTSTDTESVCTARHSDQNSHHLVRVVTADKPSARAEQVEVARRQQRVQHRSVLRVVDVIEKDDRVVLVLPRTQGLPLNEWIASKRPDGRLSVALFADICRGIQAAHAEGLSNLQPDLILIHENDGEILPVITGFSLSEDVDPRGDIYQLGRLLHRMVRGQSVPGHVTGLVQSLMHVEASQRPRSIDEVLDLLNTPRLWMDSVSTRVDANDFIKPDTQTPANRVSPLLTPATFDLYASVVLGSASLVLLAYLLFW